MATITRFEDLEIWQLARAQTNNYDTIVLEGILSRDYKLRDQMNGSSGSVMDCITEGFDRSGNAEFKNFLTIAKGSNAEFRSQLYRCSDRKHISPGRFEELYAKNITLGNKIMSFISYLQRSSYKGQQYKDDSASNIEPQTSNSSK